MGLHPLRGRATLLAERSPDDPVRIWSAGCASGQEAYTLAMVFAEAVGPDRFRQRVKIYATDVDEDALAQARQAAYTQSEVEGVPPERPPPRWKMWLISLVAVYPLVLLFQAFVVPPTASWPLPARAALFPVVLLTSMTYGVMPAVTRVFRRWL